MVREHCCARPELPTMHAHRLTACIGVFAMTFGVLALPGRIGANVVELERNNWPVLVRQVDPPDRRQTPSTSSGQAPSTAPKQATSTDSGDQAPAAETQWTGAGPLLFGRMSEDGGSLTGLRPLWVQKNDMQGRFRAGHFLYPIFGYRADETTYQWNVFELIRRTGRRGTAPGPLSQFEGGGDFEVWPFWFSRETGDPELSYHALFPIAGTIKNKLGFDRATWLPFPLYVQTEKRGVITTSVPWPIVRITKGAAHGFGIWPLFEQREKPGAWRRETYVWPLGYNNTTYPAPDAPADAGPKREIGALPFYALHTGPGYRDENFLWPFFGYTDRTAPIHYHETRYFWPLLVQGNGGDHYVNRWGPFYTHSISKGYDKTWYAWPVVRHAEWTDRGLAMSKTQVLYFLYWSEEQRSANNPTKPAASLVHVWPLFSNWDNGAGRQQFQLFSPFEVFFPGNEKVRAAWSPLFAIARHDQTAPGEARTSLLWNAITWRHNDARQEREFHLGPLFSVASNAVEKRVAIGNGLVSFHRDAASQWKVLWLDFGASSSAANQPR
jgi:hypothetical protein